MENLGLDKIKAKFEELQDVKQKLNEDKIRLETEIKNLSTEKDKLLQELFKISNTNSIQEVEEYLQQQQQQLNIYKNEIESELDNFLQTISINKKDIG